MPRVGGLRQADERMPWQVVRSIMIPKALLISAEIWNHVRLITSSILVATNVIDWIAQEMLQKQIHEE